MNIYIVPSYIDYKVFFLFREDGTEIKITIANRLMCPSHKLTPNEANYIRVNIINFRPKKSANETIKELFKLGYKDRHIADRINKPLVYVARRTTKLNQPYKLMVNG